MAKNSSAELHVVGEPRWVSRIIADGIHNALIQQHGGAPGIRHIPLLESALDRPRNRYNYEPGADLGALAAAYCIGIAKNQAFIDGNKRTAFQVMYVLLGLNGYRITASEPAVVSLMVDVASGEVGEETLAQWCRANAAAR